MKALFIILYYVIGLTAVTIIAVGCDHKQPEAATKYPYLIRDGRDYGTMIYCDKATSLSASRVQYIRGSDTLIVESDRYLYIQTNSYYIPK